MELTSIWACGHGASQSVDGQWLWCTDDPELYIGACPLISHSYTNQASTVHPHGQPCAVHTDTHSHCDHTLAPVAVTEYQSTHGHDQQLSKAHCSSPCTHCMLHLRRLPRAHQQSIIGASTFDEALTFRVTTPIAILAVCSRLLFFTLR